MFLCAEQTYKVYVLLFFMNNSYFLLDESILERFTFTNNLKFFAEINYWGLETLFYLVVHQKVYFNFF